MTKQILLLLTGLSLTLSSAGCCCLGGCFRGNACGCPPTGSYYPPATSMFQAADTSQLAYSSGVSTTAYSNGITQTAAVPGAVTGPPIYNAAPGTYTTALMPTNSLPTY